METVTLKSKCWDSTCGDGCCYTWGVDLSINGEEITIFSAQSESDVIDTASAIYRKLGYDVVIDYDDE
jgi:hypothetical protein